MGYNDIPHPLRALPQWVCWGAAGKPLKAPVSPAGGMARAGDASTWGSFSAALGVVQQRRARGIGFEFADGGGLVGVDFDHCIGADGQLSPFAAQWVGALGSYTEVSPSGTGLHVICRGRLPGAAIKRPMAEMYDRARYFTVTGNVWGDTPPLLVDAQAAITALYQVLQADAQGRQGAPAPPPTGYGANPTGNGLVAPAGQPAAAPAAPNTATGGSPSRHTAPAGPTAPFAPGGCLDTALAKDPRFAALWQGQRPNGNESADDLGLCNKLAFYLGADAGQIEAAFLASPHFATKDAGHRKKATGRSDYLARTIQKALACVAARAAEGFAPVALDWTSTIGGRDGAPAPPAAQEPPGGATAAATPGAAIPGQPGPPGGPQPTQGPTQGTQGAPPPQRRLLLTPMSAVEVRHPRYLVPPYLPKGMISILGGVSGVGKTWLALDWAAAITQGRKLPFLDPFSPPPDPSTILYFTQENDPNAVLRPRLDTLGAALQRVYIQGQPEGEVYEPLTLNDPRLEDAAQQVKPALVVFDPIQSYLGARVEMNKANEVRPVLDWLADFAKRHDCAVLLVSHMSKPGLGNSAALDRLLGSSDFRNTARSIVIVGADPEDKEHRVFAHGKNSLGPPGDSWGYHIDIQQGVVYDGRSELSADDIVKQAIPGARAKPAVTLSQACQMLQDLLGAADGGATLEQVETLQIMGGLSERTLNRAKKELGLQTIYIGKPPERKTWWVLPDIDPAKFQLDHTPPPQQTTMA